VSIAFHSTSTHPFLTLLFLALLTACGAPAAPATTAAEAQELIVGIWRLRSAVYILHDGTREEVERPTTAAQYRDDGTFTIGVRGVGKQGGSYRISAADALERRYLDTERRRGPPVPATMQVSKDTLVLTMKVTDTQSAIAFVEETFERTR
jgi:hypothetical protein